MKTVYDRLQRNFLHIAMLALISILCPRLQAQGVSTSYNLNSVPVAGVGNTAIGNFVMAGITGNNNTGVGYESMASSTNAHQNTALGAAALRSNQIGSNNTAVGYASMTLFNGGHRCTAVGSISMNSNTGSDNSGLGFRALYANTSGNSNVAVGSYSLNANTTGSSNVGVGDLSMYYNTSGGYNTAVGSNALSSSISGSYNVAMGRNALASNTTGTGNAAIGVQSLITNTTGTYNSALGYYANVSAAALNYSTALGYNAIVNASYKVRLGSTTVTKVEGPVAYTVSDGRFKTDVREDDVKGLAFIQKLRPVVYHFDTRAFTEHLTREMADSVRQRYLAEDFAPSTAIRQSGFIAQEVEAAAKAVGYDFNGVSAPTHDGDNYSLAYGQFVVPLVKAVQEQQTLIEKQQAQIAELSALVHKMAGSAPSDKAPVVTADVATTMQVFPNPSTGRFTLRIPAEWTGLLQVLDMRGRSVLRQTLLPGNPEYQLDLTAQAKGHYLLQLEGRDGSRLTEKLVIE